MRSKFKEYALLHGLQLLLSLGSVLSKLAAGEALMSFRFIALYGAVLLLFGIYGIFWQQIIKVMPLTVAYASRAATIFWGMLWGLLFFQENITPGKAAGAAIVIAGIILFALSDK